jgi:serine protease Do
MGSIRWYSLVAAMILAWGAAPLLAQSSPLEELEAKLSKQQDLGTKPDSSESLPKPERVPVPKSVDISGFGPGAAKSGAVSETPAATAPAMDPANDPTPYLGLTLKEASPGQIGLTVEEVTENSPAWKSGFRIGDRVLAVSGKVVGNIDQFAGEIIQFPANEAVTFLVDRRGRQIEVVAVMLPRNIAMKTVTNNDGSVPWTGRPSTSSSQRSLLVPRTPHVVDGRGNLGLVIVQLSDAFRRQFGIPVFRGASVLEVEKNSPGAAAGLSPGDCIVELDGKGVLNEEDIVKWKREATPGTLSSVGFYRGGSKMQTMIQIPFEHDPSSAENPTPVTPEMLTPEYVQALQAELSQTRTELLRAREELQRLAPRR